MIEIEKINEVYVKINADINQILELRDYLSCFAPNYKFNPRYKRRIWDGKISFFNSQTKLLPIGLLSHFDNFCKKHNYLYNFKFDKSELFEKIDKKVVEEFSKRLLKFAYTSENEKIDARDYQINSIQSAINNKRGIILSATASGKSLVIYLLMRLLLTQDPNKKFLFIVPNTSLVEQLYSDMESYGWVEINQYVTKLYSKQTPNFKKNVLISTWQSVYKKPQSFFENFNVVMFDETHCMSAISVKSIAERCIHAEYRFGFTGTLPKEQCNVLNIESMLGNIIYTVKSKELIDRGLLSNIQIVNILLKYPDHMVKKNKNRPYLEELATVNEYQNRNIAFKYLFSGMPNEQNTLILCTQIEHMKNIQRYLEKNIDKKYKIIDIYGKTDASEREIKRKSLEKESNIILIGTYATIGTGFNVKRINNIIFASSYKSYIKIIQAIGRGLRKSIYKKKLLLIDFVDDFTYTTKKMNFKKNHLFNHFEHRKEYYDENEFKYITKSFNI